ncbi:2'-5' RNA ligase family protein [Rhizobium sp. LjRoot254]|uniref:2'-5' RNA ligase family protein n=1 Tax=Rhizobium sp. LjRoot254 TaxID=3342297 RepID=UPI003ECC1AEE
MLNQLDFGSGPKPPTRRPTGSNLFTALRPDEATARQVHTVARDIRDMYRAHRQPLSSRRLHVSLINLGHSEDLEDSMIFTAREAIDKARFEPFTITFDRIMTFKQEAARPVVLCSNGENIGLLKLTARLADALYGVGLDIGYNPTFRPHMTLLYHHAPIEDHQLPTPITWTVNEVWLIHSLLGQGRYEFLWPLRN